MENYEINIKLKPKNNGYVHESCTSFAINLKRNLKTKVKGEVWSHIINDTLVIDIYGVNGIVFRYTLENLSSEIVQGLSSEMLSDHIHKRYKRYILNLFFHKTFS